MLRARVRADMKVYRQAVDALDAATINRTPANKFEKLAKDAARAQKAFERARDRLKKHVAEHGCE